MDAEETQSLNTLMAKGLMGWHKETILGFWGTFGEDIAWHWVDAKGNVVASAFWSPATNSADCAVLMEKVELGMYRWKIEAGLVGYFASVGKGEDSTADAEADSWPLAFCLAIKVAILAGIIDQKEG